MFHRKRVEEEMMKFSHAHYGKKFFSKLAVTFHNPATDYYEKTSENFNLSEL